ncbi:putative odorant receptor 83c [Ochlerotatus camptorhynchus]|uniref:putative odorant receptor 83c n=1 Tax=Ochlerotatus camptorhynchus TaxID=644619 RepID=UPI0031E346CC
MTFFTCLSLLSFILFTGYTVYLHWGDWFQVIETLSLVGMGSSSLVKAYSGLMNSDFYRGNYRRLTALYRNNGKHKKNNRQLVYWGVLIDYAYWFFLAIFISGSFGFLIIPMYTYIRFNERLLLINLHIPGIDTDTSLGYAVTTAYHLMLLGLAVAGILVADLAVIIVIGHVAGITDVFKNALNELDQLLETNDRNAEQIRKKLLEVCVIHQEIITYEEDLDAAHGAIVFVQVLSSVACIALSLFNFYMTLNIGILTFLAMAFFQLLQYCVMGTILTIKNDEIMLALGDTRWYYLPCEMQKMMGFMLQRSQNAVEMTIGGISLLNMETFVEIIKKIYSYSAMLMQFLE